MLIALDIEIDDGGWEADDEDSHIDEALSPWSDVTYEYDYRLYRGQHLVENGVCSSSASVLSGASTIQEKVPFGAIAIVPSQSAISYVAFSTMDESWAVGMKALGLSL